MMDHIEPDELAVLALEGRLPDGVERAHLDECVECLAEYESLVRTVALGRANPGDELEAPPSAVWSVIHGELGLAPELAADPLAVVAAPVSTEPASTELQGAGTVPAAAVEPAPESGAGLAREATVTPIADAPARPDRRDPRGSGSTGARRWWPIAAAAGVVGVLAGVAIGAATGGFGLFGGAPSQTVLATAELDAFPGWSATGEALLEQDEDGVRTIVVDLDAPVPSGDVREVWLIRSDASGLVSLGLLDGSTGRFVVPDGIDVDEFNLVDVSAEPVDGDPAHSGDSIVRGELSST
jgi:hypothetical protein